MNRSDVPSVESVQEIDITQEDDLKTELCNMCKESPNCASHECLACKAYCCLSCGKEHTKQSRFAHHRLIPLNGSSLCPRHNQELILYCFECMKLCCLVCGHFSPEHFGHKLLDIDSAHEQLEPVIHDLFSKLETVKAALRAKENNYVHEKEELTKQVTDLRTSMTNAVKDLSRLLAAELDHLVSQLDLLSAEKMLRLDFELTKTQDLQSQIEKMTLPSVPKDRLLVFLPQAKNLIAVPIHPAEEFAIDSQCLSACSEFLTRTEAALQAASGKSPKENKKEDAGKSIRQFGKAVTSNEIHSRLTPKAKTKAKKEEEMPLGEARSKRARKKVCLGDF